MKKNFKLLALALLACATIYACKNNPEATEAEVDTMVVTDLEADEMLEGPADDVAEVTEEPTVKETVKKETTKAANKVVKAAAETATEAATEATKKAIEDAATVGTKEQASDKAKKNPFRK